MAIRPCRSLPHGASATASGVARNSPASRCDADTEFDDLVEVPGRLWFRRFCQRTPRSRESPREVGHSRVGMGGSAGDAIPQESTPPFSEPARCLIPSLASGMIRARAPARRRGRASSWRTSITTAAECSPPGLLDQHIVYQRPVETSRRRAVSYQRPCSSEARYQLHGRDGVRDFARLGIWHGSCDDWILAAASMLQLQPSPPTDAAGLYLGRCAGSELAFHAFAASVRARGAWLRLLASSWARAFAATVALSLFPALTAITIAAQIQQLDSADRDCLVLIGTQGGLHAIRLPFRAHSAEPEVFEQASRHPHQALAIPHQNFWVGTTPTLCVTTYRSRRSSRLRLPRRRCSARCVGAIRASALGLVIVRRHASTARPRLPPPSRAACSICDGGPLPSPSSPTIARDASCRDRVWVFRGQPTPLRANPVSTDIAGRFHACSSGLLRCGCFRRRLWLIEAEVPPRSQAPSRRCEHADPHRLRASLRRHGKLCMTVYGLGLWRRSRVVRLQLLSTTRRGSQRAQDFRASLMLVTRHAGVGAIRVAFSLVDPPREVHLRVATRTRPFIQPIFRGLRPRVRPAYGSAPKSRLNRYTWQRRVRVFHPSLTAPSASATSRSCCASSCVFSARAVTGCVRASRRIRFRRGGGAAGHAGYRFDEPNAFRSHFIRAMALEPYATSGSALSIGGLFPYRGRTRQKFRKLPVRRLALVRFRLALSLTHGPIVDRHSGPQRLSTNATGKWGASRRLLGDVRTRGTSSALSPIPSRLGLAARIRIASTAR